MNFNAEALVPFSGKKVIITGGRGYIGTHLTSLLMNVSCEILRLDWNAAPKESWNCLAQIEDIIGDIRDPEIWSKLLPGADIIFHLAAQTSVYVANSNVLDDLEVNVLPIVNMLNTCEMLGSRPKLIFSSTVTTFGTPESLPVEESHIDKPITVYDLHKIISERYLKYYSDQGIVNGTVLRLANIYGPGPKSSSSDRGILNMMIRKALNGEELTIYGKGDNLRDYIYIEDVLSAFIHVCNHSNILNGSHIVVGTGVGTTFAEAIGIIGQRVKLRTGKEVDIKNIPPPKDQSPIDLRNFVGNPSFLKNETGWEPNVSLSDGIDYTIESFLSS